ncbi:phosphotransferase [Microlunatus parietis]|uniref:Ser/Thr protein kinase RdoA (MazF antagonist) n=1 Tax=Microlunatus parietis TaxID=682979 RepID=A0A7Y9I8X9_9ACTN|nr:phosphotransferase [Microlunatus parietis]NYE72265.1 Ser/Thr protein kinase RdoA (MazF antagonist) [Microlunatus parietis]
MGNSANLVWRLETAAGIRVIKELPASTVQEELGRAAEFERAVFEAGVVPMAEPIVDREGRLLRPMVGSGGKSALVRVHGWSQGREFGRPVDEATVCEAGRSLARIQTFGATWDAALPIKQLWRRPDRATYDAFAARWPELIKEGWSTLAEAEALVSEGVEDAGRGISTHCDHKPENSLGHDAKLIILDWDEAGRREPRIESLRLADWAKWVAGIASWYEFKAQRSLGQWAAVGSAHEEEAEAASQTLGWLRHTLRRIPRWTSMINKALRRGSSRAQPSDR